MSTGTAHSNELGAFLKAHQALRILASWAANPCEPTHT